MVIELNKKGDIDVKKLTSEELETLAFMRIDRELSSLGDKR